MKNRHGPSQKNLEESLEKYFFNKIYTNQYLEVRLILFL